MSSTSSTIKKQKAGKPKKPRIASSKRVRDEDAIDTDLNVERARLTQTMSKRLRGQVQPAEQLDEGVNTNPSMDVADSSADEEVLPSPIEPIGEMQTRSTDQDDLSEASDVLGELQHSFYVPSGVKHSASGRSKDDKLKEFERLLAVANKLPRWNANSAANEFLRLIKVKLQHSGIPERDWVLLLPHLFDGQTDLDKIEWINSKIVAKVNTWNEACKLFSDHFEQADHRLKWEKDFENCHQRRNETVNEYSDRFCRLLDQLNYAADNELVVRHFIQKLQPDMNRAYHESVANWRTMGAQDTLDKLKTVHGVSDVCITLDVARRTAAQAIANASGFRNYVQPTNQRPSVPTTRPPFISGRSGYIKHVSGTSGPKKCRFHPDATSHTTAECRTKPQSSTPYVKPTFGTRPPARTFNTTPKPSYTTSTGSLPPRRDPVTCHACKQIGHYANDPKCPARSQRVSGGAPSGGSTGGNTAGGVNAVRPRINAIKTDKHVPSHD